MGVIEQGEDLLDEVKRELLEETGYAGGKWSLKMILSQNPASSNNLTYLFLAEGVKKIFGKHLDYTEDIAVCLLSKSEFFEMLKAGKLKQSLGFATLWNFFVSSLLEEKV